MVQCRRNDTFVNNRLTAIGRYTKMPYDNMREGWLLSVCVTVRNLHSRVAMCTWQMPFRNSFGYEWVCVATNDRDTENDRHKERVTKKKWERNDMSFWYKCHSLSAHTILKLSSFWTPNHPFHMLPFKIVCLPLPPLSPLCGKHFRVDIVNAMRYNAH